MNNKDRIRTSGSPLQDRLKSPLYAVIACLFIVGGLGLFAAIFIVYVWPRPANALLGHIIHDHFRAIIGLPMIALAAYVVVWTFSATEGPIEVDAWGLKFKGASGPVIFWILVFLAISTAMNMAW